MTAYRAAVAQWVANLYGHRVTVGDPLPMTWPAAGDPCRQWIEDAAAAIETGSDVPPPPREGSTGRPWRAAPARLATLRALWETHGRGTA